jgi:hypothetical protein
LRYQLRGRPVKELEGPMPPVICLARRRLSRQERENLLANSTGASGRIFAQDPIGMWLDALDGGPGLRPRILVVGEQTIIVLNIAGDPAVTGGAHLFVRCDGDEIALAIEPNIDQHLS